MIRLTTMPTMTCVIKSGARAPAGVLAEGDTHYWKFCTSCSPIRLAYLSIVQWCHSRFTKKVDNAPICLSRPPFVPFFSWCFGPIKAQMKEILFQTVSGYFKIKKTNFMAWLTCIKAKMFRKGLLTWGVVILGCISFSGLKNILLPSGHGRICFISSGDNW